MRGRRSAARGGIALLTIALSTVGWTVVLTAPPARADCSILEPICVVEEVVDPVTDVVDPILDEVVEEIVDPTLGAVVDVSEGIEDTIAPVGDPAPIDVPDAPVEGPGTGGAVDPPPPPTAPTDPTDPVGPGGPGDEPDAPGGSTIDDVMGTPGAGGVSAGGPLSGPSSSGTSEPAVGVRRGFMDRLGVVFEAAARALAFPIALAVVVAAFLLVQNRMDRRDPRLALAPVRPGVLRFD